MTAPVIADTTVWSNFAHVEQPRLAKVAFPNVASPRAVLDEIAEGQRLGFLAKLDWSFVGTIELTAAETQLSAAFRSRLGPGEATCIAVATSRGGLLLTDDREARRVARSLDVEVSGTLGILVRLIDAGHLDAEEADSLLLAMIRKGYRCPVNSLSELR